MADLHYEWFENHKVCRIWHRDIVIPVKGIRRNGREFTHYMDVQQDYTRDKGYWEWLKDKYSDDWLLWRINNVKHERRLALRTPIQYSPTALIAMIVDKEITVNDCRTIEEYQRGYHRSIMGERIPIEGRWSVLYNNHSIVELLLLKPKMTFAEIKMIIVSEGGSVDACGIIHRAN